MPVTINGTTGIAGVDGSASTPAVQGTDTNTGIYFGADTVYLVEGGAEGLRLNSSGNTQLAGNLGLGATTPTTSGTGITFPATQSASTNANTLDDYEEGTWTPSVSSSGGSITTYTSTGTYTKIGRIVVASGNVLLNNVGTASGRLQIVPPFTAQTATSIRYIGCGNESQALGTFYQVFNISSTNFIFKTTTNGDITWTNNYQYEFEFTFETT